MPTPLRMWDAERDAPALAWADVLARLERAEEYWLVSVRADGTPTPRPVWGVWLDDRLLLSVGSSSHWRALQAGRAAMTVHLPDPLGVVIVEGVGRKASGDDLFRRFVAAYNPKYSWTFDPTASMVVDGTFELAPRTVLAWSTVPVSESGPDMQFPAAAGRWRFPD